MASALCVPVSALGGFAGDIVVFVLGSDGQRHLLNWSCLLERAPDSCVRRFICGTLPAPASCTVLQLPGWFVSTLAAWSQRFGPARLDFGSELQRSAAEVLEKLGWSPVSGEIPLHYDLVTLIAELRAPEVVCAFDRKSLADAIIRKAIGIIDTCRPDLFRVFFSRDAAFALSVNSSFGVDTQRQSIIDVCQAVWRLAEADGTRFSEVRVTGNMTRADGSVYSVSLGFDDYAIHAGDDDNDSDSDVDDDSDTDRNHVTYTINVNEYALEA